MKLLTAGAALRVLGPDRRFSTRVLAGPTPGSVVLTGGGDVLLGAGESDPGRRSGPRRAGHARPGHCPGTPRRRRGGATGTVSVLLDDSLFSGPPLSQAWSPEDVAAGEMAPLYPLALNSARFDPAKTTGPRPQDAAMTAAEAFAARLTAAAAAAGLSVAPGVARVRPGDAPESGHAKVLAEVQSATVGQQVDLMLQTSDNYLAEVMGRMTALGAGRPGSGDDAIAAVLQQVKDMGVPTDALRAADVSGLALANRVSARQLTDVVRAMTSGADTRLRAALAGFPVAGLTGTLGDRYTDAASAARRRAGARQDGHAEHGHCAQRLRRRRRRPAAGLFLRGQRADPRRREQGRTGPLRLRPCRLRLPLTAAGRPGPGCPSGPFGRVRAPARFAGQRKLRRIVGAL